MTLLPKRFKKNKRAAFDEKNPIQENWVYELLLKVAFRLIQKPLAILGLVKKTIDYLARFDNVKELSDEVRKQLGDMGRLLRAYAKGEYRAVSIKNLVFTAAALLYFVLPFDIIPDFLPMGLLDDIAILAWVYKNFQQEIEAFISWEDQKKITIEYPLDNVQD